MGKNHNNEQKLSFGRKIRKVNVNDEKYQIIDDAINLMIKNIQYVTVRVKQEKIFYITDWQSNATDYSIMLKYLKHKILLTYYSIEYNDYVIFTSQLDMPKREKNKIVELFKALIAIVEDVTGTSIYQLVEAFGSDATYWVAQL